MKSSVQKHLKQYRAKRDFKKTPEPAGGKKKTSAKLRYVIQKHAASHLHYDFRLELHGVLLSWAVPKGPSLDSSVRRLAMHVEDHPLEYGGFEGTIPQGEYGGGTVMLWDRGTWEPVGDAEKAYRSGKLKFILHGEKLSGGWALFKIRGSYASKQNENAWLLLKEKDKFAKPETKGSITEEEPLSVLSGKDLDEISKSKKVWRSA
jgi:bifunctional non-homologous end joining protein LigD